MRKYESYSDLLFDIDNEDYFSYLLSYENSFSVVRDKRDGSCIYFEEAENDASEFFEVRLMAELVLAPDVDVDEATLYGLFDCICCGEQVDADGNCHFLWFKRAKD